VFKSYTNKHSKRLRFFAWFMFILGLVGDYWIGLSYNWDLAALLSIITVSVGMISMGLGELIEIQTRIYMVMRQSQSSAEVNNKQTSSIVET